MDFSATLTAAEIEALSNYDQRSLQDAENELVRMNERSVYKDESAFEKSLRVKNTLDVFEQTSRKAPSEHALAVFLNCENQLWRLNEGTPLQHNPFLSHWVEALQRLERPELGGKPATIAPARITTEAIDGVRVLWIKAMLQGGGATEWTMYTPEEVGNILLRKALRQPFDLQLYVRMLEDEGIYEKTPEPEGPAPLSGQSQPRDHTSGTTTTARTGLSPEETVQKQKADILHNLDVQPNVAIFDITRLPITLTYLDFLTTILTNRTLEKHAIDPAPVITQYIQHIQLYHALTYQALDE